MTRLMDILQSEAKTITNEFNLASQQGEGTPQEIAEFREHAVQTFLARFFPQSYIISKGKITDFDGNQSDSIDCLILNPAHPNLIDSKGKFRLVFADGCDSAIEVKPNIARADELHRVLNQCASVKRVKRSNSPLLLTNRYSAHIIEHSRHVPFFVFSLKAFDPDKLYEEIARYYRLNNLDLEYQLDGICILNKGILRNFKHKERNCYEAPFPMGKNTGWYFEQWGEASLVGLLLMLEYEYSSFPAITDSIMKRALSKLERNVIFLGPSISAV